MGAEDDWPLVQFIRRTAVKSASANLTQTYVAKVQGQAPVIGYVTIMCAEVALQKSYTIEDKNGANKWEYQPAIRIARLACCDAHRGQKIGRKLVETVIGLVLLSIVPHVGCRFLILDAKPKSIPFYRHMGFRLLDTPENRASETPIMFMDLRDLIDAVAEA